MTELPGHENPYAVRAQPRQALLRGVPVEASLPTLADRGMSMDADGTIRDSDGNPLIRIVEAPDHVLRDDVIVVASRVHPTEVLPGESMADAMVRLRRAVVLRTAGPDGEAR